MLFWGDNGNITGSWPKLKVPEAQVRTRVAWNVENVVQAFLPATVGRPCPAVVSVNEPAAVSFAHGEASRKPPPGEDARRPQARRLHSFGDVPLDIGNAPFRNEGAPFGIRDAPFRNGDAPFDIRDAPFRNGDAPFWNQRRPLSKRRRAVWNQRRAVSKRRRVVSKRRRTVSNQGRSVLKRRREEGQTFARCLSANH